ncbi:hypothetical protein F5H01DRAFT_418781 [Linnemannia elongata]|nr:hypothetical protein F5H01DRAFT_418781 [Linnemannia elongata]
MNDNHLTLFCLVDGEATSNAFPVEIESTKTIGDLKKLIKAEKAPRFDDVAADELTLARLHHDDDDNDLPVLLDSVPVKKKLRATNKLSMVFDADLPEDTIHVIVQRPLPVAKRDREEDAGPSSSRKRHRPHTLKDAIEEAGLTEKAVVDDQVYLSRLSRKERVSLLASIGQDIAGDDIFSSLSRTALELHGANIKDMDKISAPRGILLPVVDTNDIYVREAYKDLYDTILGTFENNTPYTGNELKKHVIVTALLIQYSVEPRPSFQLRQRPYFPKPPISGRRQKGSMALLYGPMESGRVEEVQDQCRRLRGGSFGSGGRTLLKDRRRAEICPRKADAGCRFTESGRSNSEELVMEPNGSASGIMFEAYVLRAFREGGHTLKSGSPDWGPRSLESRGIQRLRILTRLLRSGRYTMHTKDLQLSCVDLLLAPRDLFQITVSKSHPIKGHRSQSLSAVSFKHGGYLLWRTSAYFCRPSHVYADFEKQDYLTSEGKVYRTVPADIQRVRQYVLKIDLESAAGGKSPGLQIPVQQNAGTKDRLLNSYRGRENKILLTHT